MKNIALSFLIIFIFFSSLIAQNEMLIGQWKSHFSFRNGLFVDEVDNYWVGATESGLIMVNKKDYSISTFTKSEGLSDHGISALKASGNLLFIGYESGNIDILKNNKVTNVNDLKLKLMSGRKAINHFHMIENKLYCSTDFGILVINPEKLETEATFFIGENASSLKVNQVSSDQNYLYAATEKGVLRALINAPDIHIYTAWRQFSSSDENYLSVAVINNQVIAARGDVGEDVFIEKISENESSVLSTLNEFRNIVNSNNQLIIVTATNLFIHNANLVLESNLSNPESSGNSITHNFSDAIYSDGQIFVSDRVQGVLRYNNGDWTRYLPQGPANNFVDDVHFIGDKLWLVPGGKTSAWNNERRSPSVSILTSHGWHHMTRGNTPTFEKAIDLVSITLVPENPSKVFVNSWGSGIFEIDVVDNKFEVANHFFTPKNGLVNIFADDRQFVRVASSAWDKNNILWATNSLVHEPIVAYFPAENEWKRYYYGALSENMAMAPLLVTPNGDKWLVVQRGNAKGLFIWNDNGTPKDPSDDYYKSAIHPSGDTDERNVGQVLLIDKDGERVTDNIYAMVQDNSGQIWLGTDKGILVNYQPQLIFNQEVPLFSRIQIAREDGSKYADYLLANEVVSAIAVDGGNRKWIGTQGSGVFLVSPDGTKQLEAFTVDNSALPSNYISSIAIDDNTGEVFFGTGAGLVSYRGKATKGESSFSNIYAFPNPVRPDFSGTITITGLMSNSNVKITDTAGRLVFETTSVGGQAFWDGRNFKGEAVKTGVYLVFVATDDGKSSGVTKIAIIR